MAKKPVESSRRVVNRKARHEYHIHRKVEAGIVLIGSEVKSLREARAQLGEAFVRINGYVVTLYGMHIDPYPAATDRNHEPLRERRLLLHRREVRKLAPEIAEAGKTLIPLSVYFNARGLAKVELAVVTGKKKHDKRQDLRKREHEREMNRGARRR